MPLQSVQIPGVGPVPGAVKNVRAGGQLLLGYHRAELVCNLWLSVPWLQTPVTDRGGGLNPKVASPRN